MLGKEERAEGKEAWNAGKESVREGGREVGGGDRGLPSTLHLSLALFSILSASHRLGCTVFML